MFSLFRAFLKGRFPKQSHGNVLGKKQRLRRSSLGLLECLCSRQVEQKRTPEVSNFSGKYQLVFILVFFLGFVFVCVFSVCFWYFCA